jgi:hypothetical protein
MVIWMHLTSRAVRLVGATQLVVPCPRVSPQTTMQPHETIASQGATQRFQREPFSTVTHWTPS